MAKPTQIAFSWKCVLKNGKKVENVEAEVKRSLPQGYFLGIFIDSSGDYKCSVIPGTSVEKYQNSQSMPLALWSSANMPYSPRILHATDDVNMSSSSLVAENMETGSQSTVDMESLADSVPNDDVVKSISSTLLSFSNAVPSASVNVRGFQEGVNTILTARSSVGPIKAVRSAKRPRKSPFLGVTKKPNKTRESHS